MADAQTVVGIVGDNIVKESRLHIDESRIYSLIGKQFKAHETVNHRAEEYARGDVHINSAEDYVLIFKRGMRGVRPFCSLS